MKSMPKAVARNLQWLADARFGLFIHWGLYAVPAGEYAGRKTDAIGEWIMRNLRIPIPEYEAFAKKFNPVRFDATAWVTLAKDAGMKYLVITTKHHDGFCMFDSTHNPYNITQRTPFKRDPLKELARACRRQGLKLGLYYSQNQDWHAPGGAGHWETGQAWDRYDGTDAEYRTYIETVVKPDLRCLLSNYGPIALVWFDTPGSMKKQYSKELYELVHDLQPGCLVNSRIGNGYGDYGSLGDNRFATTASAKLVETPATLNNTWGYKKDDRNWKPSSYLVKLLVEAASRGSNYLLNVGPTAKGIIPAASVSRLKSVGAWVRVNQEAIYGTRGSPLPYDLDGVRLTQKKNRLFVHLLRWPGKKTFTLVGLRNRVKKACLLSAPGKTLAVEQVHEKTADNHLVTVTLPRKKPGRFVEVLALDLTGAPDFVPGILQQPDGSVELPVVMGRLTHAGKTAVAADGSVDAWTTPRPVMTWTFRLREPGVYTVIVKSLLDRSRPYWYADRHAIRVTVGKTVLKGTAGFKDVIQDPAVNISHQAPSRLGTVVLAEPGIVTVQLKADRIDTSKYKGFTPAGVRLEPDKRVGSVAPT